MLHDKFKYWVLPCLFIILVIVACQDRKKVEEPVIIQEKISIISPPQDLSALLYVAEEKGFFHNNGIEVTIIDGSSGVEAAKKLVNGEVDIAMMTDFAFAGRIISHGENLVILGSIAETYNSELVARKDKGILNPSDLKGKTIGLKKGSSPDFYMSIFLIENDISLADVNIVDIGANDFVEALISGQIDALAAWPPLTTTAFAELGSNGVMWPTQGAQKKFWLITAMKNRLPGKGAITKLLKSILQAQLYCADSTTEPEQTLRGRLHLTDEYMQQYFDQMTFLLSLSSDLLSNLEYESRWLAKKESEGDHTLVPDFLEKIYFQGLDEVYPDAVSIIH